MNVKVIKIYRDKYTGILHYPDEKLEMTKERYREINGTARGVFVEEDVNVKPADTKKSTKK
jgi:hypothetical protein